VFYAVATAVKAAHSNNSVQEEKALVSAWRNFMLQNPHVSSY